MNFDFIEFICSLFMLSLIIISFAYLERKLNRDREMYLTVKKDIQHLYCQGHTTDEIKGIIATKYSSFVFHRDILMLFRKETDNGK